LTETLKRRASAAAAAADAYDLACDLLATLIGDREYHAEFAGLVGLLVSTVPSTAAHA